VTGEKMVKYSDEQITDLIVEQFEGKKVIILAPKIRGRKGHYRELFEQLQKSGYTKVRVDGELKDLEKGMRLDRYKVHDIELVVDRIVIQSSDRKRLYDSIVSAMKLGGKSMMVMDFETEVVRHFSRLLMCPTSGISYPEPEPALFSFNSPYGACPECMGLGEVAEIDREKVIPNPSLSIKKGGLAPIGEYKRNWFFEKLEAYLQQEGFSLTTPIKDISEDVLRVVLNGNEGLESIAKEKPIEFEGLGTFMGRHAEDSSPAIQRWAQSFMNKIECPGCNGTRLKK
jgi:excinuclease ABC subunit A